MRHGLIVKGRRYYSPKFDEYVTAVRRGRRFATFRRPCGDAVRLAPKSVCYLSVDDYNLCDTLATKAKMTWFYPGFDDATGTEINFEEGDESDISSFRTALRDLSEGLIDEDFRLMPNPADANLRFRAILRGLSLPDFGDYI